ncbi:MAG TPA: ATP-dependent DNA helicase RecG [Desulfitobacteriaceae bacterium]|nr:ATP-dependent DNA helicase RecG [Desulfitobacteriaceae bacterium]
MLDRQQQVVLNNLRRAFQTEERQGYVNTGAVGGFHVFILGMIPRLKQLFPGADFASVKQIAAEYQVWDSLSRRQGLSALAGFLDRLETGPEKKPEIKPEIKPAQKPVAARQTEKSELQYLKGIGPQRFKQLQKAGIDTIEDLLLYYPRRYEERRQVNIAQLKDGECVTITARIIGSQVSGGKIKVIKLALEQDGCRAYAVWFNQSYIIKQYLPGTLVSVTGKVRFFQRTPEILASEINKFAWEENYAASQARTPLAETEIVPLYPESAGLSSRVLRTVIKGVLFYTDQYFPEFLEKEDQPEWMERALAHREIHFPTSWDSLQKARERLVWEEITFLQLAVARMRLGIERQDSPPLPGGGDLVRRFRAGLPFRLTSAQERVIAEIFRDMKGCRGMARLVQGDVGSGKTVVAMTALLRAVESGYQGALMAPTEILAWQHYHLLSEQFEPLGIRTAILLGSQKRAERAANQEEIAEGRAQVIVGTHSLIQENIKFKALGLTITDEQHRFGVRQRTQLQYKGENPHVLVLTATPIPRTLALTIYGDLQLSVLDELPAGRQPVITKILSGQGRPELEAFMEEQMVLGRQIFVVCPLLQESEFMDIASANERALCLQKRFPQRRVLLLHGKMKGQDKESIMLDFLAHKADILVATTVIEVGINIPNATVMVIEGAERFGLAQIHQLRGRVGRGREKSICILMTETKDSQRLNILCRTNDGFKIAEEDLRLRGPGEILGTRQHGLPELRLADPLLDAAIFEKANLMTGKVMQNPHKYAALLREVEQFFSAEKIGLH